MANVVPKNSRYVPLAQQKSCCVPACISMVMYRRDIPLMPQELLGYHLGLIVSPESRHLFWRVRTGKRPPAGFGTQIYNPKYEPNKVFRKLKIPLRMAYHSISKFTPATLRSFIQEAVKEDRDILACFDHGKLTGKPSDSGHVCVVDRLVGVNKVRLIDPSQNQPKWRIVPIGRLYKAMQYHGGGRSGGLWELVKTKKS